MPKLIPPSSSDFRIEARRRNPTVRKNLLCARRSTKNQATLLKAPFIGLAFITGLWSKGRFQLFLFAAGFVVNGYILTGSIAVYRICGVISSDASEMLSPWLCYGSQLFNHTKKAMPDIFRPVLLAGSLSGFAQFAGYMLMAYSVLVAQKSNKNILSLNVAVTMLTRNQWIQLNLQILLSFAIWMACLTCDMKNAEDIIPGDHHLVWMRIEKFSMWFYIGTPCWIFAVMTFALESMIIDCFHEIQEIQTNSIDDVIDIYNQLTSRVFGTVRVLKYWFIVHGSSFGVLFILDIAIGLKAVESQFKNQENEVLFWIFSFASLCFVVYSFLYPSLRAAALTSTNRDLIERLNFTERQSWRDSHPLKTRCDMNEFLMFANQTNCGFRIGRLMLTNGFAWVSACFGLFGLVLKLM